MGRLAAQLALIDKTVRMPALRALWIRTKWDTVEELVQAMAKICDGKTCFVPTEDRQPIGTEAEFAIELADGTQVVSGRCEIVDHLELARRPGMRIAFVAIESDPVAVLEQLQARAGSETVRVDTRPTEQTPPLPAPENIVPANPLTEMTDDALAGFVDCELAEYDGMTRPRPQATLLFGAAPLVPPREMGIPLAVAAGSDEVKALERVGPPPARPSWLSRLITRLRKSFVRPTPRERQRCERTRMPALR